jgi:hypothetical protein
MWQNFVDGRTLVCTELKLRFDGGIRGINDPLPRPAVSFEVQYSIRQ